MMYQQLTQPSYWKEMTRNLTAGRNFGYIKKEGRIKDKESVTENIQHSNMVLSIIPRPATLFKIESILEDLRWHATQRITDGVLRHPADSQTWRTIDEKFPKIAEDTRNLRLGINRRWLTTTHEKQASQLKQKKSFNGQQEFLQAPIPMTGEQIYNEVERELAIDKESVSETVRWISYGPRATVVKYDAYNINGYTFRTKCHDGKVYQNSGVSVEAIDLHISKEVATTRQAYYYGVLQEIWVLDYRFRQIPLFKCDWVNHKSGGVKRDKLGYTLVSLNNLGHKVDPFILASQALQVFYVKDPVDKKIIIDLRHLPRNYKDT
ncbi:hypothetical protein Tco_0532502 [Tanacetum coccineum]